MHDPGREIARYGLDEQGGTPGRKCAAQMQLRDPGICQFYFRIGVAVELGDGVAKPRIVEDDLTAKPAGGALGV